jgi:restriction system protein
VRAGKHGENEHYALEKNIVTIGWNEIPDISTITAKKDLEDLYLSINPNVKRMHMIRMVGQMWDFAKEIKIGDIVALPLKSQSAIALGKIEGDYEFRELTLQVKHIRPVRWLGIIPRSQFDQDLLYSLGAFSTVCQIQRNNAEMRIEKLIEKNTSIRKPNTIDTISQLEDDRRLKPRGISEEVEIVTMDIEQHAKDQITKYIAAKFSGHDLTRIVESILRADGYVTAKSEPGKDGGIDVLAGSGPIGFNEPKPVSRYSLTKFD